MIAVRESLEGKCKQLLWRRSSGMSSPAGFAYKKRFGQHFLRDTGVLDRIVRLIAPSAHDIFLEIGAGDGALSSRLAPQVSRLFAVERDPECIPLLKSALEQFPSAAIVEGDILKTDIGGILDHYSGASTVRVAGNLPYNIATTIIDKLLALDLAAADMTFMLQLEVARRVTAVPGGCQACFYRVAGLFRAPPARDICNRGVPTLWAKVGRVPRGALSGGPWCGLRVPAQDPR
jgi:16S rRNA A1518/A1519 N6-dimethyltransferase RsmA/KsgA/DIM1 with predicted DNA glycosylase/AP lyase activity